MYLAAKRVIDITISVLALALLLPVLLIVAVLVRLSSPGPVFFGQDRLGRHGRLFRMWKFRTMFVDAPLLRNPDGSTFNAVDDPRVTSVGRFLRKTSIDELPQLWNVVRGDMSIVGGRPDLPEGLEQYSGNERDRLLVRPGLTSYAIIHGRNNVPVKRRRELDAWYAHNVSLRLDASIMLKTVGLVLRGENVINDISKNPG